MSDRTALLQLRRDNRIAFNALTGGQKLLPGELFLILDEKKLLIGDTGSNPPIDISGGGGGPTSATQSEVDGAIGDGYVPSKYLSIRKDANGALSVGDLGGDARGDNSITIQNGRRNSGAVASGVGAIAIGYAATASGKRSTASGYGSYATDYSSTAIGGMAQAFGYNSTAIGFSSRAAAPRSTAIGITSEATGDGSTAIGSRSKASNIYSTASGNYTTASGEYSIASGHNSTASGSRSTASGQYSTASGEYSTANGSSSTASGAYTTASGAYTTSTVTGAAEIGSWTYAARKGAIRLQNDGQAALTIRDSATAPTDGGATAGSETNGTLGRGMYTIQKNGDVVKLYYTPTSGGTVKSLTLGTLA